MKHDRARRDTPPDVLSAYERLREAEYSRQSRVRTSTGMGDNELRLMRYLVAEKREARDVKPSEIARHLGISSASTTALLDRLENRGSLERVSHPTDRRSVLIAPTAVAETTLSATVEAYENSVVDIASTLDDDARALVVGFLDALTEAADAIGPTTAS